MRECRYGLVAWCQAALMRETDPKELQSQAAQGPCERRAAFGSSIGSGGEVRRHDGVMAAEQLQARPHSARYARYVGVLSMLWDDDNCDIVDELDTIT
jgi:hypothetical protein